LKRNKQPFRDRTVLLIAFLICALVLGALVLKKYETGREKPTAPPQSQQRGNLLVTLFFAAPDSNGLVREGREIDSCDDPANCIETVIGELINGPFGNLNPTLPPTTTINGVRIEGDTALVDLADNFVTGLPGGSNSEMLAVYSIVDTIAVNFPQIKQVKILIDNKSVETLKGHLDLREPLEPDFTLENTSQ
jgi:spore germination protein GerM